MLLQERGQLSQIVSTVLFVLVEGQAVSDYLVDEAGIELIGLSVVDLVDLLDWEGKQLVIKSVLGVFGQATQDVGASKTE